MIGRHLQRFATTALSQGVLALASMHLPGWAGPVARDGLGAVLQACPPVEEVLVDLDLLADGLRTSSAVGLIEKLRLKSAIDNLIGRMESYHDGDRAYTPEQLQVPFLAQSACHFFHR